MPTIMRIGPYRLFFYSADGDEPHHIHIERDGRVAKYWLVPVRLATSGGFASAELRDIGRIVDDHQQKLVGAWNEYFGK